MNGSNQDEEWLAWLERCREAGKAAQRDGVKAENNPYAFVDVVNRIWGAERAQAVYECKEAWDFGWAHGSLDGGDESVP